MGGANDAGFIFKMDHNAANYKLMYEFLGSDQGSSPHTKLVEGPNGLLYGLAASGGAYGKGVIYTFDRIYNSYNIDKHLNEYIGDALTLAPNGKFYTNTSSSSGAICEYDPATKSLSIAYDYSIAEGEALFADGVLILVRDSLLYGTTYSGGNFDNGVIFEYNINSGVYKVKHHFAELGGSNPKGHIIHANGKIYGTTSWGGDNNKGGFFEYEIDKDTYYVRKHLEPIHTSPEGLCLGPDGHIYGHTTIGGSLNGGAIWRYDTTDQLMEFVHEFVGEGSAYLPTGAPMVTYSGKIFGATRYGGTGMGFGTIFEYDMATETAIIRQGLNDGFPLNTILTEVGERTVTSISIDSSAITIDTDNGTLQLSVTMQPVEANNQPVVWSVSDPAVASISTDGELTALTNGTVTVTATANYGLGVSDSKTVTISNQDGTPPVIPVSSLTVTSSTNIITSFSNTLQMDANILPANASNQTVSWFVSDNSISTISDSGELSPLSAGIVTVTAVANDGSGVYHKKDIEIINYVSSITITPSTDVLDEPYGSIDFDAIVLPADATNQDVEWSVDFTAKASITQDGVLTAKANTFSYVTITVKAKDGSGVLAKHSVSIKKQELGIPVSSVKISAPTYHIDVNRDTLQMSSVVLPDSATIPTLNWHVGDTSVITVDQNGLITPRGNGQTYVKAEAHNGYSDTKNIIVSNQSAGPHPLEDIVFEPDTFYIDTKRGTLQLTPQLVPANTGDTIVSLNWRSYNSKANVSEDGLVTALDDGTEEIDVTALNMFGGLVYSNRVYIIISNQVDTVYVDSINILSDKDTLDVDGAHLPLSTSVMPQNAWDASISWSVDDTSVATISSSGVLAAVDTGTVTITASALDGSGVTGTKQIVIIDEADILVDSILVSSAADTIDIKNTVLQLSASVYPANATNPSVSWMVNDTAIANITSDGLLTALDNGTVTVTATANDASGITRTKEIVLINQRDPVPAEVILLSSPRDTIDDKGGTLELHVNVLPINATDKTVIWAIDDTTKASFSVVDSDTRLITALKNGTLLVSVSTRDGSELVASKMITIINQKDTVYVDSVNVLSNRDTMYVDEAPLTLSASVMPHDAWDASISWSVDNKGIATISGSGVLTAINTGIVTVTATANDGSGVTGTKKIVLISQRDSIPVGIIPDIEMPSLVQLYPNPAASHINVLTDDSSPVKAITICSLDGRIIGKTSENIINVQSLPAGMYIVIVRFQSGITQSERFIKK